MSFLKSLLCVLIVINGSLHAQVITRTKDSTLKIATGACLVTNNKITNISGTVFFDPQSMLSGQGIQFTTGSVIQNDKKIQITGLLDGQSQIFLNGSKAFTGNGKQMSQSLLVSGFNNRIDGAVVLSSPIQLLDSLSSVTFALSRSLNNDILLNGGEIFLEGDLRFVDKKVIKGPGLVKLNNRQLDLGQRELVVDTPLIFENAQDITLNADLYLSATWTFSGINILRGNGYSIILNDDGHIVLERGSTLLMHHLSVERLKNSNLRCLDNAATLTIQVSKLFLDDDFSFTLGGFRFLGNTTIGGGGHTFIYQSVMPSIIASNSTLIFETGLTFSYDPLVFRQDLLQFENNQSLLSLGGGTLYISTTGMQLTTGQAKFDNYSYVMAPLLIDPITYDVLSGGLMIGNNNGDYDFKITLNAGAFLDIAQGQLVYSNVNSSMWNMVNEICTLQMEAGTNLVLEQTLDIGRGRLNLSGAASLVKFPEANFVGSVNIIN
ncbi:hypothetical protein IPF37_01040 [bacterium]|nr:MAG: hypothetical protein IPF37_01040 [bacterium]